MTMAGPDRTVSDGREIVVIVLTAAGWVYMLSHLLSVETPGTLAMAGPSMQVLKLVKESLGANFPFLQLSGSLCVTARDAWTALDFVRAFGMWMAMVLAMMLPTLLWTRFPRDDAGFCRFIGGYVIAWVPFCALAVLCQWLLRHLGVLNEYMVSTSYALDLSVLSLMGVSYLKRNNLKQAACRIANRSGPGASGASSGLSCGLAASWSCTPIMASMFIFGLMNLIAMAALTVVMLMQARSGSQRRAPRREP